MKFLIFCVFCRLAQGQTETVDFSPTVSTTQTLCQDGLKISITGKDGKSDVIARCVKGYYERVPKAADETDGKPRKLVDDRPTQRGIIQDNSYEKEWGGLDAQYRNPEYKAPAEPIDVPAVQIKYVLHPKGEGFSCGQNWCSAACDITDTKPSCADKSRILMHDENNPPRYWCHKVEP